MNTINESTKKLAEEFLFDVEASLTKAFRACETSWDLHDLYQYVLANLLKTMRDCKRTVKQEKEEEQRNAEKTEEA